MGSSFQNATPFIRFQPNFGKCGIHKGIQGLFTFHAPDNLQIFESSWHFETILHMII